MGEITMPIKAILLTALLLAGCSSPVMQLPITQQQHSFNEFDHTQRKQAPPEAGAVDGERITRARSEPQNWLTYYGAYDGQRYSPLDQINASNVAKLRPAWVFQAAPIGLIASPATFALVAAPIVVDGTMFLSGWDGHVWALNAETGQLLWRYHHAIPLDVPLCCGNLNRGVAVANGKVFFTTANGQLIALDARTGAVAWRKSWLDPRAGESSTLAPLIVKNMVIVGSSGAEYGVRGHIDAFDIDTGQRIWRRYTVPAPGEPGSETWGDREAAYRGGGSAWITGTYDPKLNLLYWGTANAGPVFDGKNRPGENLYTNSVLALNPEDGSTLWHYQFTPHDLWDYDGVNENILFEQDGRPLLAHFDRNGYLFILDRRTGERVRITQFGERVTWGRIDGATGEVTAEQKPTPEGNYICPGPAGAKEWNHAAYNRDTGLLYTPVIDLCAKFKLKHTPFEEGMAYWGGDVLIEPQDSHGGYVKAYDPKTGQMAWSTKFPFPMVASLLTTAGGLVFAGEPSGDFNALNATNGKIIWKFKTGSGIHSNPITYSVGGKQYIAVFTGWGGWLKGFSIDTFGSNRGGALMVFALP
jgi:alcohol dehydrogenase (cytochrome c)